MRHSSLFTASWVVLLLLSVAMCALSLVSAARPLRRAPDGITANYSIEQLDGTNHEAADALRGRRLTAAAWAVGCGLFVGFIVLGPYRRGERWAWWALLVSIGAVSLVSLARIPIMGISQGTAGYVTIFVVLMIGLLAGAPRMFANDKS